MQSYMDKPKMDKPTRDDARRWQRHFGVTWTEAVAIARSPNRVAIGEKVDAWIKSDEARSITISEARKWLLALLAVPQP